jgi:hypothetical protein
MKKAKQEIAEALRARASRAEGRGDRRLAEYLTIRAGDVLDTERRTNRVRPTSRARPVDPRSPPYDELDDDYRAGRSAENCLIRLVRRWKAKNRRIDATLGS